jgi:hypothetical protein
MSGPLVPAPKLPHVALPNIRSIPTIPHVGCAGAHGNSYVGSQFGNVPDIGAVLAIKAVKKALVEQMFALLKGELTDIPRAAAYAARLATITDEVADITATLNSVVTAVTNEANAAITAVNAKVTELNTAKAALEAIPVGARNAVQRLMITRYTRYVGELNAQAGRLQSTIECIAA